MSASLVGSEMCIRDSAVRAPSSWLLAQNIGAALAVAIAERRQLCSGPVSYTHLTLPTICSV
eukprot:5299176-Alexandrium_andersonii.AAC.1